MRNLLGLVLALLLLPCLSFAQGMQPVGGVTVSAAAAPAGPTSPTYFTLNTTTFDSLNYTTLNAANQIVATGNTDNIGEAYPTSSYWGNCTNLFLGDVAGNEYRGFLKFDFSSIPATATISAVELKLFTLSWNDSSIVINAYALSRAYVTAAHSGTCEETNDTSAVSWNEYAGTSTWTTAGGDFAATKLGNYTVGNAWNAFTNTTTCGGGSDDCLVEYVQKAVDGTATDYGLIFKTNAETGNKNGHSSDIATDGTRPYIKVTWSN